MRVLPMLRAEFMGVLASFAIAAGILLASGAAQGAPQADPVAYQGSFPASTPSGFTQATLTINGEPRDVLVYRPGAGTSQPLLIFFGGTGSTLGYNTLDELGRDAMRAIADQENVVIAFPLPRMMTRGDWDNHDSGTPYWETASEDSIASAVSADPDLNPDLLFTRAIIKEAQNAYAIDAARVYLNGFSNGAFFSYFAAAALGDRIAAFAETGGGLALSNTTAGTPAPCVTTPYAGTIDEARSCADAGWSRGMCSATGAVARPLAPSLVNRIPPAFMEANDNDDSVPFAHTCNLADALPAATPRQARIRHTGIGHAVNAEYILDSWNFMKQYRLPYQGLWWNPNESGWGMSVAEQGPIMFVGWYTYDQFGASTRYFMSNCAVSGNGCSGTIYRVSGGASPTVPWTGHNGVTTVGTGTLTFSDSSNGVFNFVLNGVAGSKNITRLVFGTAIAPLQADFTSLWWNSSESGWGVFLSHQAPVIFAVLYTYDDAGNPVRYVASNCAISGTGCSGTLYRTSGGSAPTVPWVGPVILTPIGTITFEFSDSSHATMSYTINGVAGAKTISKMIFYTASNN